MVFADVTEVVRTAYDSGKVELHAGVTVASRSEFGPSGEKIENLSATDHVGRSLLSEILPWAYP